MPKPVVQPVMKNVLLDMFGKWTGMYRGEERFYVLVEPCSSVKDMEGRERLTGTRLRFVLSGALSAIDVYDVGRADTLENGSAGDNPSARAGRVALSRRGV